MVQYTNAYSLSPAVKTWLANSRRPRILHVFDNACNLINEHGQVLSIVPKQIGNGPFNLVIDDKVLFSEYLNRESRITIHANQLDLVKLVVNLRDGEQWNPSPDWERIHAKRDVIFAQLTELQVTHSLKRSCFDMQFDDRSEPFNLPGLPPAQSLITSLCIAIVAADILLYKKSRPDLQV